MIILLDGVDNAGKSSLAAALAPQINAAILPSPGRDSPLGLFIRSIQDTQPLRPEAMIHLYIAEQLCIEADLAMITKPHIILDRHAMTSGPAYRPEPWSVLWPILNLGGTFRRPDLGVFLDAPTPVIRQRLITSHHPIPWTDETITAIRHRLENVVKKFARRAITLRSDQLSTPELAVAVQAEMAIVERVTSSSRRTPSTPPPRTPEPCIECHGPSAWIRHTQFAGDHPFCDSHARIEADFGESNSTTDWEQIA